MAMNNKSRSSIISVKGGILGGRLKGSLRVYSLGEGAEAQLYFSLRLWQAASLRQARLAGPALA
jgi:hypothetical protein